ncbi:MAG: hypothetical protein JWM88_495 [Verrucomicrobia bacterium]|nr:hypothetical protein [Verrucomicrobiota bacterium]
MKASTKTIFLGCSLILAGASRLVADPFVFVGGSAQANLDAQTMQFQLQFNHAPNFNTYDAYHRQAETFTIDIWNNLAPTASPHGSENLRIFGTSDPYGVGLSGYFSTTTSRASGSSVLDVFPYATNGSGLVTFTLTFAQLHETDGLFLGMVDVYQYGNWSGVTIPLSVPDAGSTLALLGCAAGAMAALNRKRLLAR